LFVAVDALVLVRIRLEAGRRRQQRVGCLYAAGEL